MKSAAVFCFVCACLHLLPQQGECADFDLSVIDDPSDPFLFHHEMTVNSFLDSNGFGARRVFDSVPGLHGALNASDGPWLYRDFSYEVGVHDLLGFLKTSQPRVYPILEEVARAPKPKIYNGERPSPDYLAAIAKRHAEVQQLPFPNVPHNQDGDLPIRELDAFETQALKVIREGHALVKTETHDHVRMLGAIRAQETCLKCHDDKKPGDLLGAFTYFITKVLASAKALEERTAIISQLAKGAEEDLWRSNDLTGEPSGSLLRIQFGELARHGFVTPTMIAAMRNQRTRLPYIREPRSRIEPLFWEMKVEPISKAKASK